MVNRLGDAENLVKREKAAVSRREKGEERINKMACVVLAPIQKDRCS